MKLPVEHPFRPPRFAGRRGWLAFTLIEVLIAMSIFSLMITGIYSSWSAIHKSSRVGLEAAADAQRVRVALRSLEQALGSVKYFLANETNYSFVADTTGDAAYLSFVSHLPDAFPRSGLFPHQPMRRLTFTVEPSTNELGRLVLRQQPFLYERNIDDDENPLSLAADVTRFQVAFLAEGSEEWEEEWLYTNALPMLVHVTLGIKRGEAEHLHHKLVSLASSPVPAEFQVPPPVRGGSRGRGDREGERRMGPDVRPLPPQDRVLRAGDRGRDGRRYPGSGGPGRGYRGDRGGSSRIVRPARPGGPGGRGRPRP